jgi:hypothetical protein
MKKKIGRNDPCPCGSGKKFKKCCESTMLGGKFKAAQVDSTSSTEIHKTAGLTSLFKASLSQTPKKPAPETPNSEEKNEGDSAKS